MIGDFDMAGQNTTCLECSTQCIPCNNKPNHHRDMTTRHYSKDITLPREVVEQMINLCPDDKFRALVGEYLR